MDESPNPFKSFFGLFNLCLFVLIIWVLRYATDDFTQRPTISLQSIGQKPMNADQQDRLLKQMDVISKQLNAEGSKPGFLQPVIDNYSSPNDAVQKFEESQEPPSKKKEPTTQIFDNN